jgi:hypothetical protein
MVDEFTPDGTTPNIRDLARRGVLADFVKAAAEHERRRLRAEAYVLVQPVVFNQLTHKLEINRGHYRCAVSVKMLEDDCLDRFHDDMDAVLDDVFRNVRMPIMNLEGWVRRRLTAVTIDAYRRRRGERGALQRPRIPRWLATRLADDPRLLALAVEMLEFAGLELAAGTETWPIDTWAARRAATGGDYEAARRAVLRDVETVIEAMRTRPKWYADYLERPLGRKRAPLIPAPWPGPDAGEDHASRHAARDDAEDARLTELAAVAVAAIEARLASGEEPRTVVVDVLTTVFAAGVDGMGRPPGEAADIDERVAVGLADRASIDRLVTAVLAILADGRR